jgi:hypothetical protein
MGTGEALNEHVTHRSRHYQVETARLYSVPRVPPPIYVSGFGEKSARLAARIADGYICMGPQADLIKLSGTKATATGPCRAESRVAGRRMPGGRARPCAGCGRTTASRASPRGCSRCRGTSGQLARLVTEDMVSASCGPDPWPYIEAIRAYQEASFDEVYLGQVGGWLEGAFDFLATQVLPRVRGT